MDRCATVAEADREYAHEVGRTNADREWILSDRDVWYRNPFYTGPRGRHPEDDGDDDDFGLDVAGDEVTAFVDRYEHAFPF